MRSEPDPATIRMTIPGTPGAVSAAVAGLARSGIFSGLSPDDSGTAEIVLAEVLNNVVEHAYSRNSGEIEVSLRPAGRSLWCTIIDCGAEMPGSALPAGQAVSLTDTDMPEGGFGWFLIRALACDLTYRRDRERNILSFRIALEQ